jgi:uncharacterized transporter YbjL
MDAKTLLSNVSVGYALTYLIGTVVVILIIRYVPRLLKLNLEAMTGPMRRRKVFWEAGAARKPRPTTSR